MHHLLAIVTHCIIINYTNIYFCLVSLVMMDLCFLFCFKQKLSDFNVFFLNNFIEQDRIKFSFLMLYFKIYLNRKQLFEIVTIFHNITVYTMFLWNKYSIGEHKKQLQSFVCKCIYDFCCNFFIFISAPCGQRLKNHQLCSRMGWGMYHLSKWIWL